MNRYVVAVGGTGQHVALALADFYILAHSVTADILPAVNFVLVDADPAAGGQSERSSAWTLACEQLDVLAEMPDAAQSAPRPEWKGATPRLKDEVKSAGQALDEIFAPGASSLLLTGMQEAVEIGSGYHGEPRVAAAMADVLLKELLDNQQHAASDPLGRVINAMQGRNNRVCIVGSAIGGTGAGILPRLVTNLAATQRRQAKLCAVIGLPWFQLRSEGGLSVRMRDNARACLWHYFRTMEEQNFRLVLWGHPNVESAREESYDGDRMQGVKSDLSLPLYAAAAAQAFLIAPESAQGETELDQITVGPVGPAGGEAALTPSLDFGGLTLAQLIERNNQLFGILELLHSYLVSPPKPSVFTTFLGRMKVPTIDRMQQPERDQLRYRIEKLVAAKKRALKRLSESDRNNHISIGEPAYYEGIPTLKQWFPTEARLDIVAGLLSHTPSRPENSEFYMLPSEVMASAPIVQAPAGSRNAIQRQHRESLAPFAKLYVSRIPDIRGVEMVLLEAMQNRSAWKIAGFDKLLPGLLLSGRDPVVPPRFGAADSDNYLAWAQRWFLTFTALMGRLAYIEPLDKPLVFPGGREIKNRILLHKNAISAPQDIEIGFLSDDVLVVPSMSPLWEDAERLQMLSSKLDAVSPAQDWIRAVRQVGECKLSDGITPPWLSFLGEVLPDSRLGAAKPLTCDESQYVITRWGAGTYPLPLPSKPMTDARAAHPLVEFLCHNVFHLEIQQMDAAGANMGLNEEQRLALQTVQENQARIQIFDEDWAPPRQKHVLWLDRIDNRQLALINDGLFLVPNLGHAMEIQNDALPLRLNDIFTQHILVLQPPDPATREHQPLISVPVKSQYAALVDEHTETLLQGNRVDVSILLTDGRKVERTYRGADVILIRPTNGLGLLSWPYRATSAAGAHDILFAQRYREALSFRVLYGNIQTSGFEGLSIASRWMPGSSHFYHLEPYKHDLPTGHGPLGIVIRSNGIKGIAQLSQMELQSDDVTPYELGIIPYKMRLQQRETRTESWCVDFGSSSSVVARYFNGIPQAGIVSPQQDGDATAVYSLGSRIGREELAWFATWEGHSSADSSSTILPSQIIERVHDGSAPNSAGNINIDRLSYGQDFVLDNGQKIDEAYLNGTAGVPVPDLKWRHDAKGRYRLRYLQHMLEQAVAMESMRSALPNDQLPALPSKIDLTFTLPLRQRNELRRFSDNVEEVCRRLRRSVDIEFIPKYQWESLAVVPPRVAVPGHSMFVVADLGGGTLDMYAACYLNGERVNHALESARVGGKYCVEIMTNNGAVNSERYIRENRLDPNQRRSILSSAPDIESYFEIIHRFIILWVDSLRELWSLEEDASVYLMLAGLGWSLPGSKETQANVAKHLNRVGSEQLNIKLDFEAWGEDPAVNGRQRRDENRKTFLARTCAQGGGVLRIEDLLEEAEKADMVLGLEVQSGGEEFPQETRLQDLDRERVFIMTTEEATKVTGQKLGQRILGNHVMTQITNRLSSRLRDDEEFSGSFDPVSGHLVSSALAIVAEEAIKKLAGR